MAIDGLCDGGFYNAGQSCCGMERIYVHEKVADEFIAGAVKFAESFVLGDPLKEGTTLGPMAQESGVFDCETQVADALKKGAILKTGSATRTTIDGKGRFFAPTVLVNCSHSMSVMHDETFGPVLPIQIVKSDDEAVALMNDSEFGLTAAVFTSSLARFNKLAPKIETGTVFRNRCDYLDPELPWTGVKDTGKGISLSKYGFGGCTRLKGYHVRL